MADMVRTVYYIIVKLYKTRKYVLPYSLIFVLIRCVIDIHHITVVQSWN